MDATLNPQNENQPAPFENGGDKSELMQVFESQVKDIYWAYRDLLREIFAPEK